VTKVMMREITNQEISDYIATKEPRDKAGSYAIQEKGAIFVDKIDGSFSNVVGLPLAKLVMVCRDLGYQIV
jgi:septum formation protein